MNIGLPSVDTTCGNSGNLGPAITETASIAYTGELLPAGTALYKNLKGIL